MLQDFAETRRCERASDTAIADRTMQGQIDAERVVRVANVATEAGGAPGLKRLAGSVAGQSGVRMLARLGCGRLRNSSLSRNGHNAAERGKQRADGGAPGNMSISPAY